MKGYFFSDDLLTGYYRPVYGENSVLLFRQAAVNHPFQVIFQGSLIDLIENAGEEEVVTDTVLQAGQMVKNILSVLVAVGDLGTDHGQEAVKKFPERPIIPRVDQLQ